MHILMNGWFLGDLKTGSGQYTLFCAQELLREGHKISIILSRNSHLADIKTLLPQANLYQTPRLSYLDGRIYKIIWEKMIFPAIVKKMSGDIVWTPYLSLSSIPNKPHAMTVHDVVFERYPEYTKGRLANWYLNQAKKAARQADGLITISQFSRSEILELWRPTSPVFVATLASSKPMSVHQDLTNKVNVLYVGGFDLRKNIPALIEAFATVVRSFPEARLFLPGRYSPSSLVPDLQDIIEQFALQKHIVFPGFVSDEELAQLFQKTRVFVYPSTYEGFGLPILEAMGQGVPVICADQGAMSEVAGDAAYTVDVSDKKALAQAIKEVLESDTLAKSLQEKGYQHVENFSWGETGRSLLEAFQVIAKNYN